MKGMLIQYLYGFFSAEKLENIIGSYSNYLYAYEAQKFDLHTYMYNEYVRQLAAAEVAAGLHVPVSRGDMRSKDMGEVSTLCEF